MEINSKYMKITKVLYKEGWLYINKIAKPKFGDLIESEGEIGILYSEDDRFIYLNQGDDKFFKLKDKCFVVVAQSSNLNIPDLPYIEQEEDEWSHSKFKYSDDDIFAAIHMAQSASNFPTEDDCLISRNFLEQYFRVLNEKEIEIEMDRTFEVNMITSDEWQPVKYTKAEKTFLKVK